MIAAKLTKSYGTREVLSDATITIRKGTVHALVGENGAGKSTLVKILAGVVPADRGTMTLGADKTSIDLAGWNRIAARAAGIGIVQQHGSSAGTLSVVENAVLGVEPGGLVIELDDTAMKLRQLGARLGLTVEPFARVDLLTVGAAQRAEIVAALHQGAEVLILDEPTAVLTPIEVDGLLATLRGLASEGKTVVIVTHKLDEVRAVADDVTVLRAGTTVATFAKADGDLEPAAIARAMVGAELPPATRLESPPADAPAMLRLACVGVGRELADVTLDVRKGELVGIAGVDGNGQRELALAIAGLVRHTGSVRIGDRDVSRASPAQRLAAGLAHIPEDRQHGGLLLDSTVADNLTLGRSDITGRFRIDRAAVLRFALGRIDELDVRPPDPAAIARALSGGNQQKVVVGRELSRPNLRAVIAAQPTRGVDLGAVARIHERLRAAAKAGAGVLVISADLDELLALCHRICVVLRGTLVGELAGDQLRGSGVRERIGAMMTGADPGKDDGRYRQADGRASP